MASSSVSGYKFNVSVLPNIFHSFSEHQIVHQHEEVLLKIIIVSVLSSAFISMYGLKPCFMIELDYPVDFPSVSSGSLACFKALMCMTSFFCHID